MARLMEHMILKGSTKYPSENAFSHHLAGNGGSCNSSTEFEMSNFQFNVNYSGLEMALEILAACFERPLLLSDDM